MKVYAKIWIALMLIWMSCVDKVNLSLPTSSLPLIIDGLVTDQPGPYTVKISRAFSVDGSYHQIAGVALARVEISDNSGARDVLKETFPGTYVTDSLQGVIGRTYRLRVTTAGGLRFESAAEYMHPAGTVDSIYFQFKEGANKDTQVAEEGFNIYINSTFAPGSNHNVRWKFNGTYKVTTNPALVLVGEPPAPIACSEGCLCCTCWVSVSETAPILANSTFLGSNVVTRVLVGYIPINQLTFNQRYRVEIVQMEVSQEVFDFFTAVKGQVDHAASLFQPPFFKLKGNVKAVNNEEPVLGIFSAAATSQRVIYMDKLDIPHPFTIGEIAADCRAVAPRSTIFQPSFWQ